MSGSAERPWWRVMRQADPALYARNRAMVAAAGAGGALSPRLRHLLWLAVDSVINHLYVPGARLHAEAALAAGATPAEILATMRLAMSGMDRGLRLALPILEEELARAGLAGGGDDDGFLAAMAAALDDAGSLPPADAALLRIAIEACPSTPDPARIRTAIREGLTQGLTRPQIAEAVTLASLIGLHAYSASLGEMEDLFGAGE